jgi:hypothetical protein
LTLEIVDQTAIKPEMVIRSPSRGRFKIVTVAPGSLYNTSNFQFDIPGVYCYCYAIDSSGVQILNPFVNSPTTSFSTTLNETIKYGQITC